jgi:diadenosine tetraphosphate (Ap4A) HIT family hydrolase
MTETMERNRKFGRFAPLMSSDSAVREIFDTVLFDLEDCIVAPTLGSIVPNWLLVIPTCEAENFAKWRNMTGNSPFKLVQRLASHLRLEFERITWFEHGPSEAGSIIGCGVDHAHLHVLIDAPFEFSAFEEAAQAQGTGWEAVDPETFYETLSPTRSYMIAGSREHAFAMTDVEQLGSQYLRKVVAKLVRQPHAWDYRTHPHIANVRRTVEALSVGNGQ